MGEPGTDATGFLTVSQAPSRGPTSDVAIPDHDQKFHQRTLQVESDIAIKFLRANAWVSQGFRLALLFGVLGIGYFLFQYVYSHADPMANVLLERDVERSEYWSAIVAVLLPVVVLLLIGVALVFLSLHVQSRSVTEFERLMSKVSRIRRDSIGVARTRSTSFVLEESLHKTSQAFSLQLWMGRTLFTASLILVVSFAVYSVLTGELDRVSFALAAGSVVSFFTGAVTSSSDKVGNALGDVTQMQLVVMTTAERLGVASESAYTLLEVKPGTPETRAEVMAILTSLKDIAHDALHQIQEYAEPRGLSDGP